MSKVRFSETQFSVLYILEFIRHFGAWMPFLPNTRSEGRYFGFDLCIGGVFIQFKIADVKNIVEIDRMGMLETWTSSDMPCYVKKLDFSGRQFEMLKRISNIPRYRNSVFYVMQEFHKWTSLKENYRARRIVDRSAHFRVSEIQSGLTGKHTVVYSAFSDTAFIYSDPKSLKKVKIKDAINRQQKVVPIYDEARKIASQLNLKLEGVKSVQIGGFEMFEYIRSVQEHLLLEYDIYWIPLRHPLFPV